MDTSRRYTFLGLLTKIKDSEGRLMDTVRRSKHSFSQGGIIKKFRAVITLLIIGISLGIAIMWIMMPTNTYYQKWRTSISNKVTSSFLGESGTNILIWTFPMLFIAALGGLYLHLGEKLDGEDDYNPPSKTDWKSDRQTVEWKKPVMVKGSLGIVTVTELAFVIMFVALLVWSLATQLHNALASVTQVAEKDGTKVWIEKLMQVSFYLGLAGNIFLAFLFFPVARGSTVLPLLGLTSEGSIKYHIWLGHTVMVFFTAHGIGYIVAWIAENQAFRMIQWKKLGMSPLAGDISLLAGLGLWITTFPQIRRKAFELFFYTHHLYIIFMVFFILHVGIDFTFNVLPAFYLFMIDRYLRFLQSQRKVRLISARVLSCNTCELNFTKTSDLSYNPSSVMFVNVPSISRLQWHSFTVSSSSKLEPERISVIIKTEGSWSKKLYDMISSPNPIDRLEVALEGPYGPASTHYLRHDLLVMVSGGSGITSFISIIRELSFLSKTSECKIPKILLICAFKTSSELAWLDLLMPVSGVYPSGLSSLQLQIEAYVTRTSEIEHSAEMKSKHVDTVWFKPLPTDVAMSRILGPNSWLWLAAIISSSFIIFLILIGIVTRYYIYPIDENKSLFNNSGKAVINMLFLCVSIAATASGAVFLNRRKNTRETPHIQSFEGATPEETPESQHYSAEFCSAEFYNADLELASFPQRSILDATNVHIGKRPDLKRLLLECEGSNVGVLASGPKKLRHEVAAICASGLFENLHFESISFTW